MVRGLTLGCQFVALLFLFLHWGVQLWYKCFDFGTWVLICGTILHILALGCQYVVRVFYLNFSLWAICGTVVFSLALWGKFVVHLSIFWHLGANLLTVDNILALGCQLVVRVFSFWYWIFGLWND